MLIPTPGPYVETRNGLIMNYCDILMGGSRSIRFRPRRGNFSIRENQKKGTLKYAKRTQFIGLSTPTIRYTNFPPQKRLQKKDSLNMRNEAILINKIVSGRCSHLPDFAAHVDMCRAQKCYPKSREEPKPRSYGAQWFCHFNYGRTISFPDKSWNSGSALPTKFRGSRRSSCANKKNSKITNEAIFPVRSSFSQTSTLVRRRSLKECTMKIRLKHYIHTRFCTATITAITPKIAIRTKISPGTVKPSKIL